MQDSVDHDPRSFAWSDAGQFGEHGIDLLDPRRVAKVKLDGNQPSTHQRFTTPTYPQQVDVRYRM